MQTSALPSRMPTPFADSGTKNAIPVASQVGVTAGLASFTTGFPPLTMTPVAAGGVPPFGADFNGILNAITQSLRWANAGMGYPFDSAFSASVNGYPKGALLPNSTFSGFWLNTVEGNTTAPEASDGTVTGWVPMANTGSTAVALTGSSVTLTSLQAAKDRLVLSGALTANVSLYLPAWTRKWTVINNCTGAFTVTVSTASGTGVAVPINTTAEVFGDGTNIALGNPLMVKDATQPAHAMALGQASQSFSTPVGTMRNGAMRVASASQSATFTADEVVVETALGGQSYRLASFSQTINLATTGAGGMDTGSAPATGFVALYAIYNPTTKAQGILAVNATAAKAPEVYGGSNMPSGYTASALVSVYPTNSSGQFVIGQQFDRDVYGAYSLALNTSTAKTSYTALSISTIVPLNAKRAMVSMSCSQGSSGSGVVLNLSGSADGIGGWGVQANSASSTSGSTSYGICPILTAQTLFYSMNNTNSGSYQIYINGYSF